MNLSEEVIKSILSIISGSLAIMIPSGFAALILMYSDLRSLKKSMNAAHSKIRDLEAKVCDKSSEK